MINAKTTRETLREHLKDDAALLKDFGELAAFTAVVASGTALAPAAFAALVVKTASSAITAGTRFLERLGNSGDSAARSLPSTYERFRVMFYVACQRAFLEAVSAGFASIDKPARRSRNDKAALEHVRKTLEQAVTQIEEGEVRFRYSLDPTDEPIPLFKVFGEWVTAALTIPVPDYFARSKVVESIQAEALKRLHVALAADDDAAEWMRRYLALQRDVANAASVKTDLASIRSALEGWLEETSGKRQREEAWTSYREMLQQLPDARETMFNEEFGVRKVFVAPRVTYQRAGMSESGEKAAVVPDLGTIFGALLSTRVSGDDLIILSGGPGSGKSTLCRLLASELAKNHDVHPVFLRLRKFKEGGDLSSFLADTLENVGLIGRLSDLQFLPNVVIILDGFDELVMASRARLRQFFRSLLDDVHSGPLRKAKVLVSGRDTLFPGGDGLPRGSHVLTLLPFDKERVALWGEKWRRLHASGPGKTFRPEAFVETNKQGKATSPLQHLVTWPLTLHLVARTHTAGKLDVSETKSDAIRKAYLYRSILADTAARQLDQTEGQGRLEPSRMRDFLRSLAWEMHARGVDSMDIADVTAVLKNFYPDAADAELGELSEVTVVNQPELQKGEDKGFEFVHKSFAEYLVGERLASIIDALTYRVPEPDGTLAWRQNRREACRSLAQIVAPRPISAEIRDMLAPMLGAFGEFTRDARVDETIERQNRIDGLKRVIARCQELYSDFFGQDALLTVSQLATHITRQQTTLQLYANYGASVVIVGVTAADELKRELADASSTIHFNAEPFDGAFWRWLFIVSGWSPAGADAARLLEGISVHRDDRDVNLSERSCPVRFGDLESLHGYTSEVRAALEELNVTMHELLRLILHLTTVIVSTSDRRNPELAYELMRDMVGEPIDRLDWTMERLMAGNVITRAPFRPLQWFLDEVQQSMTRNKLSNVMRDIERLSGNHRARRALDYIERILREKPPPSA